MSRPTILAAACLAASLAGGCATTQTPPPKAVAAAPDPAAERRRARLTQESARLATEAKAARAQAAALAADAATLRAQAGRDDRRADVLRHDALALRSRGHDQFLASFARADMFDGTTARRISATARGNVRASNDLDAAADDRLAAAAAARVQADTADGKSRARLAAAASLESERAEVAAKLDALPPAALATVGRD